MVKFQNVIYVVPVAIAPNNGLILKTRTRSKDEPKITLIRENMDILIGDILNMTVIHSGCTESLWR